jgi:hypothetical protein
MSCAHRTTHIPKSFTLPHDLKLYPEALYLQICRQISQATVNVGYCNVMERL